MNSQGFPQRIPKEFYAIFMTLSKIQVPTTLGIVVIFWNEIVKVSSTQLQRISIEFYELLKVYPLNP